MGHLVSEKTSANRARYFLRELCHKGEKVCTRFLELLKDNDPYKYDTLFPKGSGSLQSEDQPDEPPLLNLGGCSLSDLERCAGQNEEQLIRRLEQQLEPEALAGLRKDLPRRRLKAQLAFSPAQFYRLYTNKELEGYLHTVHGGQRAKHVPKVVQELLFGKGGPAAQEEEEEDREEEEKEATKEAGAAGDRGSRDQKPPPRRDPKSSRNLASDVEKWRRREEAEVPGETVRLDFLNLREHGRWKCLLARGLICCRAPGGKESFLLVIPPSSQEKKLFPSGALSKYSRFELQFQMGVVGDVDHCRVFSGDGGLNLTVQYEAEMFRLYEKHLLETVERVLLPLLAQYRKLQREVLLGCP
ncbi:uncharacterized protein LOC119935026 isoform X2 [Tachyglossus aculeatus]|nr:uncharacterized protein LOC119935026 isoform X2 [Tachyglossus aculeatus]